MRFGLSLAPFEQFADPRRIADLARDAEQAGWDGFFLWDHMVWNDNWRPILDPWIALAAAAMTTSRIRLGTLITSVGRRRPWKVARETAALDLLSGGRMILGVGLGSPAEWDYGAFGEETTDRIRAQKLDEGLDIIAGLWSGEPFHYDGLHYNLREMVFLPRPVQTPRIPIWVAGRWPNKAPILRAARWDGACPEGKGGTVLTPDDWRDILAFIREHRDPAAVFDAVHLDHTPADPAAAAAQVQPYADAGVTWWIEYITPYVFGLPWDQHWPNAIIEQMIARLRQGPPRL
jgi:alkanesulfonate monooxygenase SsuD/methylene tetrahydromethanopterin reductase-like flavin-dependent oxidoreductase (luciferase family)